MDLPKAHNGVCSCVITTIVFSLAKLSNADGRQTDVTSAGKSEENGIDDE